MLARRRIETRGRRVDSRLVRERRASLRLVRDPSGGFALGAESSGRLCAWCGILRVDLRLVRSPSGVFALGAEASGVFALGAEASGVFALGAYLIDTRNAKTAELVARNEKVTEARRTKRKNGRNRTHETQKRPSFLRAQVNGKERFGGSGTRNEYVLSAGHQRLQLNWAYVAHVNEPRASDAE